MNKPLLLNVLDKIINNEKLTYKEYAKFLHRSGWCSSFIDYDFNLFVGKNYTDSEYYPKDWEKIQKEFTKNICESSITERAILYKQDLIEYWANNIRYGFNQYSNPEIQELIIQCDPSLISKISNLHDTLREEYSGLLDLIEINL